MTTAAPNSPLPGWLAPTGCDRLAVVPPEMTEEQLRTKAAAERYARTWWDALNEAVRAHPDANQILADARRRAGR
ncbi:hypothetical protein [Streptomyces niveus]|uniref:hypothetical protein n=1 Tax=Streptomyces niveus TaxID=193462 RepID=UPI0034330064